MVENGGRITGRKPVLWFLVCILVIFFVAAPGCTEKRENKFNVGDIISNGDQSTGYLILNYSNSTDEYSYIQVQKINDTWTYTPGDSTFPITFESRKTTETDNPVVVGYSNATDIGFVFRTV
jgi:hypothetical protein